MQSSRRPERTFQVSEWRRQCELLRSLVFQVQRPEELESGSGLLRYTDVVEVENFSERVLHDLRTRKRRGASSLEQMYQGSLAGLRPSERQQLLLGFCRSAWFARYGEVVGRPRQLCIEEAFYRYLCDRKQGPSERRRLEFLDALLRALAVQPSCAFALPVELEKADFGYFALATFEGRDMLFAKVEQGLIRGPVSRASAQFMRERGAWSSASPWSRGQWDATARELAAAGIVFGDSSHIV